MEKVDRLEWRSGLSFDAYGVSIGVRTNNMEALARAAGMLPPGAEITKRAYVDNLFSIWVGEPSGRKGRRNYHLLYMGAARLARTQDLGELFDVFENYVTLVVAYFAQSDVVFVHAGVVGWRGQAIVIPGRTHTGKSTLVAALVKAGATYYSDEMAIFDSDGLVRAYPVPLMIRGEDGRYRYTAQDLGVRAGQEPLPLGLVVVTEYAPGASWRPRRLSPGRTVMALLDNTVAARRTPESYLPILARVTAESRAIKSKRDEADLAAFRILSYVGRASN